MKLTVRPLTPEPARTDNQNMWFGTPSMFEAAGFEEVARRKPERPIMRLRLVR